jgi:prepilin-type N-terminal cleavage/methylation domain-containing protein
MKGFTLIEVVVTVAISLLVTGFIIVNYNSYNNTQLVKQSALTLKNNIRFAESNASAGVKLVPSTTPAPISCTQLSGYTMSFTASRYVLQADCVPEGLQSAIVVVDLPQGVVFQPIPPSITFKTVSRGTSLSADLTITLSGSGKLYTLTLTPSGDISDKGFQ